MPDTMETLAMPLANCVLLVIIQILEQVLEQPRVLLVPWACIRCLRTLPPVRRVPALPTPPLSNAPLVRTKKLPPVMPGILGLLVMPLAKRVLLVPLQIRALVLVQPIVLFVPLGSIL